MTAKPRVALFIDAENAPADYLPQFLDQCRLRGRITIARCYGSTSGLKKWGKAIAEHHLMPILTPPSANKANASDFALTIDAVSLLHRNLFDHAVIASSDADFTLLAIHIREHGKGIDGIGEAKAKLALRTAFDQFIIVGDVSKLPATPRIAAKKPEPAAQAKTARDVSKDDNALMEAIRKVLPSGANTTLSNLGKQVKALMGERYPSGKLSTRLSKHRDTLKIDGMTVKRLR